MIFFTITYNVDVRPINIPTSKDNLNILGLFGTNLLTHQAFLNYKSWNWNKIVIVTITIHSTSLVLSYFSYINFIHLWHKTVYSREVLNVIPDRSHRLQVLWYFYRVPHFFSIILWRNMFIFLGQTSAKRQRMRRTCLCVDVMGYLTFQYTRTPGL